MLDSGDGRVFDVTRRLLVGALHGRSEVPPAGAARICLMRVSDWRRGPGLARVDVRGRVAVQGLHRVSSIPL